MNRKASAFLAAVLSLAGCAEEGGTGGTGTEATAGEEVSILRAFPPSTSGGYAAAAQEVHRDAPSWAEAWKRANAHRAPIPAAPPVDFGKEMVALAALGQKPNAGYGVEIVGVRKGEGRLKILFALREPPPGAMAATVLTNPWHAVVLPRDDGPVEWVRYEAPSAPPAKK